jgi:LmbE family N-acetylglucosaminyl deacetylase
VISLDLTGSATPVSHVLCLGAHADDIEIGCAGTVLTLLNRATPLTVTWVIFSAQGDRAAEARWSAQSLLADAAKRQIELKDFQDGFFPYSGAQIKEAFEELKTMVSPDLVFTHYRHDLHQDHRLIAELTWNTFRDHLIFEYEVPKYDGDLGSPNVFVPVSTGLCRRKIDTILAAFKTQRGKRWFSEELFTSLLRIRGMECNAPSNYAEAFYCRKLVVG